MTDHPLVTHTHECDVAAIGCYVEFLAATSRPRAGQPLQLDYPGYRVIAYAEHRPEWCDCTWLQLQRTETELRAARRRAAAASQSGNRSAAAKWTQVTQVCYSDRDRLRQLLGIG